MSVKRGPVRCRAIITLRPRQDGRHFEGYILKRIFFLGAHIPGVWLRMPKLCLFVIEHMIWTNIVSGWLKNDIIPKGHVDQMRAHVCTPKQSLTHRPGQNGHHFARHFFINFRL